MSSTVPWLPPLTLMKDYCDFDTYFEAVYGFYSDDFIHSKPKFNNLNVASERMVAYQGKDHSFWHCIEEKLPGQAVCEDNRIPKIALCERIRWPRPVIEHALEDNDVLAWIEIYRGRGTKRRVHLYFRVEQYVVVLDPRGKDDSGLPKYYYLWTTFLCEGERRKREMLRRYENGDKIC